MFIENFKPAEVIFVSLQDNFVNEFKYYDSFIKLKILSFRFLQKFIEIVSKFTAH